MLTPGTRTGRARETHFHWTGVRPCSLRLEKPSLRDDLAVASVTLYDSS